MTLTLKIILIILILQVLVTPGSWAAGLGNVQDGWLLQTREIVQLLKSETHTGLPPNALFPGAGVWGIAGAMQLYGMPELPVKIVGFGGRCSCWGFGCQWQRSGEDLFKADVQSYSLSWEKNGRAGLCFNRKSMEIGSEPVASWSWLTALWEPPSVHVADYKIRCQLRAPLWASADWRDHEARQCQLKLAFSKSKMALVGAFDKKSGMGWALGLELTMALGSGLGITIRADPDTGSLGPGTLWMWGHMLLKTSHVTHPELGVTHRVTLTTGSLGSIPW